MKDSPLDKNQITMDSFSINHSHVFFQSTSSKISHQAPIPTREEKKQVRYRKDRLFRLTGDRKSKSANDEIGLINHN